MVKVIKGADCCKEGEGIRIHREVLLLRYMKDCWPEVVKHAGCPDRDKAQHINIIEMLDVFMAPADSPEVADDLCIVMEDGGPDLSQHWPGLSHVGTRRASRVEKPTKQIAEIAYQVLRALVFLHSANIIHRDLKLNNIAVRRHASGPAVVKLLDFGLARPASTTCAMTRQAHVLTYRAPELVLSETSYSASVDMWSFGCILAELLTEIGHGHRGQAALFHVDKANMMTQFGKFLDILGPPPEAFYQCLSERGAGSTVAMYAKDHQAKNSNAPPKPFVELPYFAHVDPEAVDLLSKILRYDPAERLTAEQALDHAFFKHFHAQRAKAVDQTQAEFARTRIASASASAEKLQQMPKIISPMPKPQDPFDPATLRAPPGSGPRVPGAGGTSAGGASAAVLPQTLLDMIKGEVGRFRDKHGGEGHAEKAAAAATGSTAQGEDDDSLRIQVKFGPLAVEFVRASQPNTVFCANLDPAWCKRKGADDGLECNDDDWSHLACKAEFTRAAQLGTAPPDKVAVYLRVEGPEGGMIRIQCTYTSFSVINKLKERRFVLVYGDEVDPAQRALEKMDYADFCPKEMKELWEREECFYRPDSSIFKNFLSADKSAEIHSVVGGTVCGTWKITEHLEAGSFGRTWRAESLVGTERAVLKTFMCRGRKRSWEYETRDQQIRKEVECFTNKTFPRVAEHAAIMAGKLLFGDMCLRTGAQGDVFVLQMEEGQADLYTFLCPKDVPTSFSDGVARRLVHQIAGGVAHLHEWGWHHRDLKIENIIVMPEAKGWSLKIIDFGFVKIIDASDPDNYRRQTATKGVGTGATRPLESESRTATVSYDPSKFDVWSLGCTSFFLVAATQIYRNQGPLRAPGFKTFEFIKGRDSSTSPSGQATEQAMVGLLESSTTLGAPPQHPRFWAFFAGLHVSAEYKQLASKMLDLSERDRIESKDVLAEQWFAGVDAPAAAQAYRDEMRKRWLQHNS